MRTSSTSCIMAAGIEDPSQMYVRTGVGCRARWYSKECRIVALFLCCRKAHGECTGNDENKSKSKGRSTCGHGEGHGMIVITRSHGKTLAPSSLQLSTIDRTAKKRMGWI